MMTRLKRRSMLNQAASFGIQSPSFMADPQKLTLDIHFLYVATFTVFITIGWL